jgi:hypothetical protein
MGGRSRSNELARSVFALLGETPGAKNHDLASRLGTDREDVTNALLYLEKQGVARREGRTRGTRWYLLDGAQPPAAEGGAPAEAGRKRGGRKARGAGKAAKAAVAPRKKRESPKTQALEAYAHLIGVETDAQVAAKAGVSRELVAKVRRQRNIPGQPRRGRLPKAAAAAAPARRGRGAAKAAAAPAPSAPAPAPARASRSAANGRASCWAVRVRSSDTPVYVIASGLTDAAARAVAELGDSVVSIERLGEALGG